MQSLICRHKITLNGLILSINQSINLKTSKGTYASFETHDSNKQGVILFSMKENGIQSQVYC